MGKDEQTRAGKRVFPSVPWPIQRLVIPTAGLAEAGPQASHQRTAQTGTLGKGTIGCVLWGHEHKLPFIWAFSEQTLREEEARFLICGLLESQFYKEGLGTGAGCWPAGCLPRGLSQGQDPVVSKVWFPVSRDSAMPIGTDLIDLLAAGLNWQDSRRVTDKMHHGSYEILFPLPCLGW